MTYARDFDALIAPICEDRSLSREGVMAEGLRATWLGLPGVPREAETIVLERDLRLVALTGSRYHAALISNRLSLEAIARAREAGLPVTCGVSINHLTLNELDVGDYRTFLKLKPPLRAEDERLALVEALAAGLIDVICSDHDPQDVDTKRLPFAEAAAGAIGVETMLSASLRLVAGGHVALPRAHSRHDFATRRDPAAASRQVVSRRAGRRHPLRSGRALCARSRFAPFALPQYALRCGPARGPDQDDAGCRAASRTNSLIENLSFNRVGWKRAWSGFLTAGRWRWRSAICWDPFPSVSC